MWAGGGAGGQETSPRMRPPGPPPLAPLRSFSSPNCCHGCLPITLRTQSRLLVSHLAPLANLLPPQPSQCLNFPKSWLPRASVWAVPPPRPLSSAQKTSLLEPSRLARPPLHLSSDIHLPDPQSEEAPAQRSEPWADLEF